MRLTSFKVQGFKNLVAPVELAELGAINVIHGANNVGKSNVMQAIEVFFRVLAWAPDALSQRNGLHEISGGTSWLKDQGISVADIFNYATPHPVEMTAEVI